MEIHYEIAQSLVARKVAGELLLVPVQDNLGDLSFMYTANETGTRVWDLLVQKRSITEIKRILKEEYDTEEEKLENDLKNFVEQLVSIGALR